MDLTETCEIKAKGKDKRTWKQINADLGMPYADGGSLRKNWRTYQGDNEDTGIAKNLTGKEERKPKLEDMGDYYIVRSGKRIVEITKDKLRRFKKLYCAENWEITKTHIELNMTRGEFMLVKNAFSITHNDIPYIDEDLKDANVDELAEETLIDKKRSYFNTLHDKEIKTTKRENEQYRTKEFWLDKIAGIADKVIPLEFNHTVLDYKSNTEAQLDLADWHTGMRVDNYWNVYNYQVLKESVMELLDVVIEEIKIYKPKIIHVMNLGDLIHGLIHTSTRVEAEFDVTVQIELATDLVATILDTLSHHVHEVKFYNTYGNHSRFTSNKKDALDTENFELLFPRLLGKLFYKYPNIKHMPNEIDDQWIVADICGHIIIGTHGDRDKPRKAPSNITMMYKKPYKIHIGHAHHLESWTEHSVEIKMVGCMCGVETYAKDLRKTSVPSQKFSVYSRRGLIHEHDIEFKR